MGERGPPVGEARQFWLEHGGTPAAAPAAVKRKFPDKNFGELIHTGPVDEFFQYRYGKLPYWSLDFKFETHNMPVYQSAPVINYPNDDAYTRITEFKYLTGQQHDRTTIVYEYPQDEGDPYYPIPRQENAELYRQYQTLAEQTPNVWFAGRLATYKYYNMDQVVAQALTLYNKISSRQDSRNGFRRAAKQTSAISMATA